jgi:HSP20 family protein
MFSTNLFDDFVTMHRNFDQLFSRVFGDRKWSQLSEGTAYNWMPPVESYIKDNLFVVRVFLPGIDPQNVEVSTANNVITIRGQRPAPEAQAARYLINEMPYGTFERRITLPEEMLNELDRCAASFTHGVLEISLPVRQKNVRQIPIQGLEEKKQITVEA